MKKAKHPPFIMLPHSVYDSPEFRSLSSTDIAILLLLIYKWNGSNNGNIALGVREAAMRCHCAQMTACRSLKSLQDARLITATYKGHMVPEIGRPNAASRWRVTFIDETKNRGNGEVIPFAPLPK